jgi:hypothetical protein
MIKITVTRDHIDRAIKGNSHRCMIADAIRAAIPKARFILVDLQTIRWSDLNSDEREFYLTPAVAQQAIVAFDQGEKVDPFSFTLHEKVRARKVRREWKGNPKVLAAAQARYNRQRTRIAKLKFKAQMRRNRMNPARDREFGIRRLKGRPL